MPSIAHFVMGGVIAICLYYISNGKFTKTHAFIFFLSNYLGPDIGWVFGIGYYSHSLLFWPLFALLVAYVYYYFTRFTIKIDGIKHIEIIDLEGHKLHYLISSVMAGLAVLTKGPVGIFIPAAVVFLYIVFSRQWKRLKDVPIVWCILIFLVVSLPWYLLAVKIHGTVFISEFFGFRNITRFLEPEHRIGIYYVH